MDNYRAGRAAFHKGIAFQNAPYDDAGRRIPWVKGWSDSRNDYYESLANLAAGKSICQKPSVG
jgi:ribosome modulation factor